MSYKSINSLIFRRIRKQKLCVNAPHKLVLRQPSVCLLLMRSMFLNLQTSLLFQSKVVSSISVRTKSYFGESVRGSYQKRNWPEAPLTGSDHVRMRNRFPRFFLTIVVVQNVPLPSWIVKRYGQYERKASWIVKRYGNYGRKVSWIVKRFGEYGRKENH